MQEERGGGWAPVGLVYRRSPLQNFHVGALFFLVGISLYVGGLFFSIWRLFFLYMETFSPYWEPFFSFGGDFCGLSLHAPPYKNFCECPWWEGRNIRDTVFLMFLLISISRLVDITSRECKLITGYSVENISTIFLSNRVA